jgi:PAS domain S-box-containing protein
MIIPFAYIIIGIILYALLLRIRTFFLIKKVVKTEATSALLSPIATLENVLSTQIAQKQDEVLNLQKQLENEKEKYQLLTDNIAASIVIRNASNKIIYASPYTEVLTGYSISEIYNSEKDFHLKITHDEDHELLKRAVQVTVCGEPFQFRHRFFHKTGLQMWAETRTVPILDNNGELFSSLSITIDVTGSVLYQKQVEEKNRDLQDLTYMVSHDLKAPIVTIKGMVGVIEEDCIKSTPQELLNEPLGHITKATNRLEKLVSSVLEYSRVSLQDFKDETVDLNEVLQDVLVDHQSAIKNKQVTVEISSTLPKVIGERIRLYQIVSNLIGNSIKYSDESRNPIIKISVEDKPFQRHTNIVFTDNGIGIPNEKISSIFRPFQRANAKNIDGFGIGLACVKKLVDKSGGYISVKSELNQGSSFIVSLRKA